MTTSRPLTAADAEAYVALRKEMLLDSPWAFLASEGDDANGTVAGVCTTIAAAGSVIFGVAEGGRLLGVTGLRRVERFKRRHIALIWGVYVTPSARGRGIARAMIVAAIEAARAWEGVTHVQLSASEKSVGARRLYESLGFVPWGVEPSAMRIGGELLNEIHLAMALR